MARGGRQEELPGMEDREIKPLQEAAMDYAEVRDSRIALNKKEFELKTNLLKLMKSHKRQHYHCNGVDIEVVVEEETVKVRIEKDGKKKKKPKEE